jgi:hypothetical protein
MRKALFRSAAAFLMIFTCATTFSDAKAADLSAGYTPRVAELPHNCQELWRCGPDGCATHRVCARPCGGYDCHPLYGAYGPYGGVGYWGAFTDSGWGR